MTRLAGATFRRLLTAGILAGSVPCAAAGQSPGGRERAARALASIAIPNAGDVRGNVTLPTTVADLPGVVVEWTSSNPSVVSDRERGLRAPGVVVRPPVGARPVRVTLKACSRSRRGGYAATSS